MIDYGLPPRIECGGLMLEYEDRGGPRLVYRLLDESQDGAPTALMIIVIEPIDGPQGGYMGTARMCGARDVLLVLSDDTLDGAAERLGVLGARLFGPQWPGAAEGGRCD